MTESTARQSSTTAQKSSTFSMLKRYAVLAYGALGTMLDVGLMVLGAILVGLAMSVLLAGFDLVDVVMELPTATMLASALVLAVAGLFCLGVASEGPLGRGRRLTGFKLWEVGIGRTIAVFAVGFGAIFLYGILNGLLDGMPDPLVKGAQAIRAVGISGMTVVPLIGVPLSLAARVAPTKIEWVHRLDVPVMFIVWAIAAMMILV
ncbi:MAG: hypothetical protein U9N56_10005 [Actinomycetota bacterium]|nr:hypothetical protein [Actinomycetota bacterium]